MYNFTNPDTQEVEQVPLEDWIWGALYDDGTELHQFTDDGIFHRIGEVDQSKVNMWTLYQPEGKGDGRIDFIIPTEEDGKKKEVALIHKYRNLVMQAGTPQEKRYRVYMFGFKIKGQKSFYNYVLPNGTVIQSTEDNVALSQFVQK